MWSGTQLKSTIEVARGLKSESLLASFRSQPGSPFMFGSQLEPSDSSWILESFLDRLGGTWVGFIGDPKWIQIWIPWVANSYHRSRLRLMLEQDSDYIENGRSWTPSDLIKVCETKLRCVLQFRITMYSWLLKKEVDFTDPKLSNRDLEESPGIANQMRIRTNEQSPSFVQWSQWKSGQIRMLFRSWLRL